MKWTFWSVAALALGLAFAGPSVRAEEPEPANFDEIFRCQATDEAGKATCAKGREIVMDVCTRCHSFVRVVRKQATRELWASTVSRMKLMMRDVTLSPEDTETLLDYVSANFNDDMPPPHLPPALMEAEYPGSTDHPDKN